MAKYTATLGIALMLYSTAGLTDTHATNQAQHLPPIIVEADEFEVNLLNQKAIWRGDVLATQGNYTFRASSLTIHLDQLEESAAQDPSGNHSSEDTPKGYELSADDLSYDLETARIVGRGNSELRRGVEMIRAEHIIYRVEERLAIAKPSSNGRVFVQFLSNPERPVFPLGTPLAASAGD